MTDSQARQVRRARAQYDTAYSRLISTIRDVLADGATVTEVAREAKWSREYIGQIRAGTAGDAPPKRRAPKTEPDDA